MTPEVCAKGCGNSEGVAQTRRGTNVAQSAARDSRAMTAPEERKRCEQRPALIKSGLCATRSGLALPWHEVRSTGVCAIRHTYRGVGMAQTPPNSPSTGAGTAFNTATFGPLPRPAFISSPTHAPQRRNSRE